jgi:excisionase family DNA binding protein
VKLSLERGRTAMKLLTAKEVASILRVKPERVYALVRAGLLPSVRIVRQIRFEEMALMDWIARGGTAETPDAEHMRGERHGLN